MLPAVLTTVLWSVSVVFAARSAAVIGPERANIGRLTVATLFLGCWAFIWGTGIAGPAFPWLFLSGIVGFGLGDMGLFGAIPRIGPRLTILLTQCLAAPIAALVEWIWLGTLVGWVHAGCALVILAGVGVALAPDRGVHVPRTVFFTGIGFGLISALGQAFGTVISRKANSVMPIAVDGGTQAFQRILGGLLCTVIGYAIIRAVRRNRTSDHKAVNWRKGSVLVVLNAAAGPTCGVACFQWALASQPAAIVLPIVATSPVVTIFLTWALDGLKPTRRAVIGGVVAVLGAAALAAARVAR